MIRGFRRQDESLYLSSYRLLAELPNMTYRIIHGHTIVAAWATPGGNEQEYHFELIDTPGTNGLKIGDPKPKRVPQWVWEDVQSLRRSVPRIFPRRANELVSFAPSGIDPTMYKIVVSEFYGVHSPPLGAFGKSCRLPSNPLPAYTIG